MSRNLASATLARGRIARASPARLVDWSERRRFATAAFIGQLIFSAVAFGGTLVTARTLGPAGKGEFTTWSLITLLAATTAALSISTGFGRAYLRGSRTGLAKRAVQHAALAAAIAVPVGLVLGLLGVVSAAVAILIAVAVPTGTATLDLLFVMQAAKRGWAFQATRVCNAAVFTVGMVVFAWLLGGGVKAALLVWGAATLIPAVVAIALVARTEEPDGPSTPELAELQELGGKAFVANLGDWFLLRLDQLLAVVLLGPAALGIYSVAVNCSEIPQYIGHSIGQAMFEDERTLAGDQVRSVLRSTFIVVALATLGIVGIAWVLIDPLFGGAFHDARWSLVILAPGVIGRSLGFTAGQILLARGRGQVASRIVMVTVLVGVAGWVGGALTFGLEGIALSTTIVYSLYAVLTVRQVLHKSVDASDGSIGQGEVASVSA